MATIKNTITLADKMTPVLKSVVSALNSTVTAMQSVDGESAGMFNEARGNIAEAERALESLQAELNDTTDSTSKTTDGFTVMRGVVANLAADLGRTLLYALKNVAVQAFETASDLVEVQNIIDVTFAGNASSINAWSTTTLDAYGLNELAAKKYSGTLGAMFKSAGHTSASVMQMSTNLTTLAGDMASFYNLDTDTAFTKLRAGISGETEPLRQLGINMTVATLEAFAMANGFDVAFDSMSEAQKQMIRYMYIMEATADAQGDFTRTQDEFANQQRLVQENFKMFTAAMVSDFLPILAQMLAGLNELMARLKPIAPILGVMAAAMVIAVGVFALLIAAQWAFNAAVAANPIIWIIAAIIALIVIIAGLIAWLIDLWKTNDDFRIAIISAWHSILNFIDTVPLAFMKMGNAIATVYENINGKVMDFMQNMINTTIDGINYLIEKFNALTGASVSTFEYFTGATEYALESEAKQSLRADEIAAKQAEIDAKKAERDSELAQMKIDASAKAYNEKYGNGATDVAVEDAAGWDNVMELDGGTIDEVGQINEDVTISDDDIQLLKDVAAVEFINQYTTLRPELQVTFGDVRETADVNGLLGAMEELVETAYASTLIKEAG